MILRPLTYKWTQEDRLTRCMWMRGVAILYGCILLLVFAVMASIKPAHVAQNRTFEPAMSHQTGDHNADYRGSQKKAVRGP
jgi:hypothetical protein